MSQRDTDNRLRTGYLIKKQQNQAISRRVRRELRCCGWNRPESTMQLARFFRD
jgi:hypothetical protein